MLKGKTVVLAVSGSIAAYKIANLARMLKKLHCNVTVMMTQNSTNFINPITFETITGNKCLIDTFDRNFQYSVEHVALAKQAGVVLTEAGATFPYHKDPEDKNIRIAPSFPPIGELETAMKVLCCCVKLASVEKLIEK